MVACYLELAEKVSAAREALREAVRGCARLCEAARAAPAMHALHTPSHACTARARACSRRAPLPKHGAPHGSSAAQRCVQPARKHSRAHDAVPQVRAGLGHIDPYFGKLADGMTAWINCWTSMNPEYEK